MLARHVRRDKKWQAVLKKFLAVNEVESVFCNVGLISSVHPKRISFAQLSGQMCNYNCSYIYDGVKAMRLGSVHPQGIQQFQQVIAIQAQPPTVRQHVGDFVEGLEESLLDGGILLWLA